MAYIVVNKKGKKVFDETFTSKTAAEQAIIDAIAGANSNGRSANALKYYREFAVRKKL